jgi:uncharacterized membrane protein (UPF0127 family)
MRRTGSPDERPGAGWLVPTAPPPPALVLVVDGRAVAPVEVAATRWARARGLLGRPAIEAAMWLPGVRSVHTFGMATTIDVARCDGELVVLRIDQLAPGALVLPLRRARHTLEAGAGSFTTWGLRVGSHLQLAPSDGA